MPADPKLVRDLFLAAAELPTADRVTYLSVHCGDDAELRVAVERLLAAHEQPASVLNRPAPGIPTANYAPMSERPGTVIGPYKLMEQIGEGGFGLVFVAEQQQPVRRKVALKVIKPGMDTREVIARFEAERQALALMDHPNIAKVLDAGETESGRPYFVMELVKGIPIVEYCDQIQLTARERLELFLSVCQAVQHAHGKGVIHRDLKPNNILVAPHDGVPVVKVIDFGVAKAIGQQLTDKTIYTRFNQMIGTPLYMSPEQAEINALDVDIRSDVYSLGVLLYELLTGTTPFDRQRFATAAYDEIRRIIREEEPPKPSTRLSTLGETLSKVSVQRKTEPAKLSAQVKGDLDWIVMKALEKDRNRRYETASAFAADVRRFLGDEPIEARPPSAWYRFHKLARRNKVALTTAALVAAALVLGTAVSAWQAVRATRAQAEASRDRDTAVSAEKQVREERDRAVAAERKAKTEKENTQAALNFLWQDVLSEASPLHEPDRDLKVRTLLDRVADRLNKGSGESPVVEATVGWMVGELYADLGENSKSLHHLERALVVQQRELGEKDPQTLATMHSLGVYHYRHNQLDKARELLGRTLELRRSVLGEEHHDTLVTMRFLGGLTPDEESVRLLRKVLEIRSRVSGEKHRETVYAMLWLAGILGRQGHMDESEELGAKCLNLSRQVFGDRDYLTLTVMGRQTRTYLWLDKGAQAEPLAKEALEGVRGLMGDQAPRTRMSKVFLAQAYQLQGKHADATPLIAELLAWPRPDSGGFPGGNLGVELCGRNLIREKKYAEAEQFLREFLEIAAKRATPPWGGTWGAQILLGASLLGQTKYAEAEPLLVKGCEGMKQRSDPGSTPLAKRQTIEALGWLVQLYEEWGKPDEAAKWRKQLDALKVAAQPAAGP